MDDNTDIVERLRSMYYELSRRQASTPFGERSELDGIPTLLYEAATKIHDLRGNEIQRLRKERDEARRDACEFGAMLETDANPNYDPESGDFAKIAMRIAHSKGWDCWRDYENKITMTDNDIVARLNRILSAADERGLDETECRAIQDAICEIGQLRQRKP